MKSGKLRDHVKITRRTMTRTVREGFVGTRKKKVTKEGGRERGREEGKGREGREGGRKEGREGK